MTQELKARSVCPNCGGDQSEAAPTCPHCGYALDAGSRPVRTLTFDMWLQSNSPSRSLVPGPATAKRWGLYLLANILILLTVTVFTQGDEVLVFLGPVVLAVGALGPFVMLALSKAWAIRAHGIRVLSPQHLGGGTERNLYDLVAALSRRAGLPAVPDVGIYESPDANAFATGPSKNRALVAFSTALLDELDEDGIAAVAAHEVAHVASGDMVTLTLVQSVVNSIVLLATLPFLFVRFFAVRSGDWLYRALTKAATVIVTVVLLFLGSLVVKAFSRHREFQADRMAASLTSPAAMITALAALQTAPSAQLPEQAEYAAFKIHNPPRFWEIFCTHPSLERRIAALRGMGGSRTQ